MIDIIRRTGQEPVLRIKYHPLDEKNSQTVNIKLTASVAEQLLSPAILATIADAATRGTWPACGGIA